MHRQNLRHLRAFAAIVDAEGFARAADRLHLSQPALSRQIHALEGALGVPLFDRVGRGVRLTSQGEDLLRRSRRLLVEADALFERASALKSGKSGILRLGATPQVIENVLGPFLAAYGRSHPGIEVRLVEDGGSRMPERLARGDVHLACMPGGDPRFDFRPLHPTHLMAVVTPRHSLARRATVEIAALAEEPLLVMRREFGSRSWLDAACVIARVQPRLLMESAVPQTIVALAARRHGVAIVPSNVTIPQRTVRLLPVVHRGAPIGRWLVVGWDPQRFLAPYAGELVDELTDWTKRSFPGRNAIRRALALPRPKG